MRLLAAISMLAVTGFSSMSAVEYLWRPHENEPGTWMTYGKSWAGWRYSGLDQINKDRVAQLVPQWVWQTEVPGPLEATPLVYGGLMFITGASNHAWALDAQIGHSLWHYVKLLLHR